MANYKESSATGTTWTRSNCITIQNTHGQTPRIIFTEEKAVQLGDTVVTVPDPRYLFKEFNKEGTFPIIDPITGEETGDTGTHSQIYVLLHSLYMQTAKEQDIVSEHQLAAMQQAVVDAQQPPVSEQTDPV